MTEILLIRHTQAEGNLYRMMQGHWDGDVTEHGWVQIEALAQRLRDVKIDAVYSSDLYRARMTAGAVTKYHPLALNIDKRLRELDMGPWEAGFFGNIMHDHPQEAEFFLEHPASWCIEGAETYAQVQSRAYAALCDIARENDGRRVAVVSHGVTIRCLLAKLTDTPLEDVEKLPIVFNTAITTVEYENGKFTVKDLNDCAHLDALNKPLWRKLSALRDEAIDPMSERALYCTAYSDAWRAAHGTLMGYDEAEYLRRAEKHHSQNPYAVLKILDGDDPVGIVDMDTQRGAAEGIGWISLIWLREDYRGNGYGIQLLGRAIKLYKSLGRQELRLCVARDNANAIRFYESHGFTLRAVEQGELSELMIMARKLGGTQHDGY